MVWDLGTRWLRAALVSGVLVLSACGPGQQEEGIAVGDVGDTTTTIAPETTTTAETVDTTTDDSTTDTGDTTGDTTDQADAGSGTGSPSELAVLDANYDVPGVLDGSLEHGELRNLFADVHGPTDDIAAELNRIGIFPAEFPTIAGSDLQEYSMRLTSRDDPMMVTASATIAVDAPFDEVIAFYESGLNAPAFTLAGSGDGTQGDLTYHTKAYDTPTSEAAIKQGLELEIISGDFEGTVVRVDFNDVLAPADNALAFDRIGALDGWETDAPIPEDGQPFSMFVQTSVAGIADIHYLRVQSGWVYPLDVGPDFAQQVFDLVGDSSYDFKVNDGDPTPDEALQTALADGENLFYHSLSNPERDSVPTFTIWNLDESRGAPYIEFDGGTINLRELP